MFKQLKPANFNQEGNDNIATIPVTINKDDIRSTHISDISNSFYIVVKFENKEKRKPIFSFMENDKTIEGVIFTAEEKERILSHAVRFNSLWREATEDIPSLYQFQKPELQFSDDLVDIYFSVELPEDDERRSHYEYKLDSLSVWVTYENYQKDDVTVYLAESGEGMRFNFTPSEKKAIATHIEQSGVLERIDWENRCRKQEEKSEELTNVVEPSKVQEITIPTTENESFANWTSLLQLLPLMQNGETALPKNVAKYPHPIVKQEGGYFFKTESATLEAIQLNDTILHEQYHVARSFVGWDVALHQLQEGNRVMYVHYPSNQTVPLFMEFSLDSGLDMILPHISISLAEFLQGEFVVLDGLEDMNRVKESSIEIHQMAQ